MASLHFRRPQTDAFDYLCGADDTKPSRVIFAGDVISERMVEVGTGTPLLCPECVAAHLLTDARNANGRRTGHARDVVVSGLLRRVEFEVAGTPRASEVLERYRAACAA